MTTDQVLVFGLCTFVFVFLIWGRWRYDLVAFIALLVALLTGVVPKEEAFSGFGHPATVIIALVLIVSRGLSNSGAIEFVARFLVDASRKLATHITIMSGLAAGLSALAAIFYLGVATGIPVFAIAALGAAAATLLARRLIGGYNGDTLGAAQQVAETAVLTATAAAF